MIPAVRTLIWPVPMLIPAVRTLIRPVPTMIPAARTLIRSMPTMIPAVRTMIQALRSMIRAAPTSSARSRASSRGGDRSRHRCRRSSERHPVSVRPVSAFRRGTDADGLRPRNRASPEATRGGAIAAHRPDGLVVSISVAPAGRGPDGVEAFRHRLPRVVRFGPTPGSPPERPWRAYPDPSCGWRPPARFSGGRQHRP